MKQELIELVKKSATPEKGIVNITDIDAYVDKLLQFATIITYYSENKIRGFIGYYKNDVQREKAYLSIIIVDEEFQGKGIGKRLLNFSIRDITQNEFDTYYLEVLKSNTRAQNMYAVMGFVIKEDRNTLWLMEKKLRK